MQLVYECDSGRSRYSIKSMACRFAAHLRRDMAKDDTSQNLHGSGTVASDGVFEQAPQIDAKHFRMCNSSLLFTVMEPETYARSVSPSH